MKIIQTKRYRYHGIFRGEVPFYYAAGKWFPSTAYATRYPDGLWVRVVAWLVGGQVVNEPTIRNF